MVYAQQSSTNIEDLIDRLKEDSQKYVIKYDLFFKEECCLNQTKCIEDEIMSEPHKSRLMLIGNFSTQLAVNFYNNPSHENKTLVLEFLNEEFTNLSKEAESFELSMENLTMESKICDNYLNYLSESEKIRIETERDIKEAQNKQNLILAKIYFILVIKILIGFAVLFCIICFISRFIKKYKKIQRVKSP
jgi:hypothetical protein